LIYINNGGCILYLIGQEVGPEEGRNHERKSRNAKYLPPRNPLHRGWVGVGNAGNGADAFGSRSRHNDDHSSDRHGTASGSAHGTHGTASGSAYRAHGTACRTASRAHGTASGAAGHQHHRRIVRHLKVEHPTRTRPSLIVHAAEVARYGGLASNPRSRSGRARCPSPLDHRAASSSKRMTQARDVRLRDS
jgi:hypothetical protein